MSVRFDMEVLESRTLFAAAGAPLPISFSGPTLYTSGQRAIRFTVADFNGDGLPDVAVANRNSNTFSIFINIGGGKFAPAVRYNVLEPQNIVAGDFLGNGRIDLAVICAETNNGKVTNLAGNNETHDGLSLFLNNGNGTFDKTPINYAIRQGTRSVAVGDFSHDGLVDLAVTGMFGLTTIKDLGNGLLGKQVIYQTGGGIASFVTAADLTGNGNLDLILAKGDTSRIKILMGNGDGTFTLDPSPLIVGGINPISIVAGDFNGDGKEDLVIAGNGYKQGLKTLLGNGDGTFQSPITTHFTGFFQTIAGADFNGDGKEDIVAVDFTSSLQVFVGNGDGTFQPPIREHGGDEGLYTQAVDVNGDGKPDLLFTRHESLYVLLNTSP